MASHCRRESLPPPASAGRRPGRTRASEHSSASSTRSSTRP
jgi:hypothetical protein